MACYALGNIYTDRREDYYPPIDELKALHYWIRAAEVGCTESYNNIANYFAEGVVVSVDKEKANVFDRMGAAKGCIIARNLLGCYEYFDKGNRERGIRHWKIAAAAGNQISLNQLKRIYIADGELPGKEFISKEDLDKAFRICHESQQEVKSEGREKHGHGDISPARRSGMVERMRC